MLILIAHGSHNPEWRASVERVVREAQSGQHMSAPLRLAYMDCTPPTLMEVVAAAIREGVTSIRVLPLFLADQGHVDRDVRPLVDQVRQAYPKMEVEMLPAMGQHPEFVRMLYEIAESAG